METNQWDDVEGWRSSGSDTDSEGTEIPVYSHPLNMRPVPRVFHFMKRHLKKWPNSAAERSHKGVTSNLGVRNQVMKRKSGLREGEVTAAHALLNIAIASNVELDQDTINMKRRAIPPGNDLQLSHVQPRKQADADFEQHISSQMATMHRPFEQHYSLNDSLYSPIPRRFGPFRLIPPFWNQSRIPPPTAVCSAHQLFSCST